MNALVALYRVEAARDVSGDRTGDEHPAVPAPDHLCEHPLQQIDGAGHIGVDRVAPVRHPLIEERPAGADPGVGAQHVDGGALGGRQQAIDALDGRQVGLDPGHLAADLAEGACRIVDLRLVGGNNQVVSRGSRESGELETDPGRSAGDDGELGGHANLLRFACSNRQLGRPFRSNRHSGGPRSWRARQDCPRPAGAFFCAACGRSESERVRSF